MTSFKTAASAAVLAFAALAAAPAVSTAQMRTDLHVKSGPVRGWPRYLAMGAIGGPNETPPQQTPGNGADDFQGRPVDVVFKYAGVNGNGDPGVIDPPANALRMTNDLNVISDINDHPSRVAIVEYTAQMSGGYSVADFTNTAHADPASGGTFLMARHLISLGADAMALDSRPVVHKGVNYFGTLILNPDLLGAIQQGGNIAAVNEAFTANSVNTAVDQAMCLLTRDRTYFNTSSPNGGEHVYTNKTYTGTPVEILQQMLADGYPVWSISGGQDAYWNTAPNNLIGGTGDTYSQVGSWFNTCTRNPAYNQTRYPRPDFADSLEGWVQANNWIIRTFSRQGRVTFGWQENMWAANTGFWLHADLSNADIASRYSTPISTWLNANAPSAVKTAALGDKFRPDYFVFDRYETDDSSAPGQATLYSARSWDNYLTAVGQFSNNFSGIPIMLWQIPGSHIPYVGEADPVLLYGTTDKYIFSTAPDYFFGDSNLRRNLQNMVGGPSSATDANAAVGNFKINCGLYNCPTGMTYRQYLTYYKGAANNFDWGQDNHRLGFAAANHVFAILWGGGNTTNVKHNFSNPDDHGWLAGKIVEYYKHPTILPKTSGAAAAEPDAAADAAQ